MAHPVLTKGFYSYAQKQPCYLGPVLKPTHLPLSHPYRLVQNLSPKDIVCYIEYPIA